MAISATAEDYFSVFDKQITQSSERFLRLTQGIAGLLMLTSLGGRSFRVLGKTFTLAGVAEKALWGRMALLALELPKTAVNTARKENFKDLRKKDYEVITLDNAVDGAFLVVDIALLSAFFTHYAGVIAPNQVTNLLDKALTPVLTFGFTGVVVSSYGELNRRPGDRQKAIAEKTKAIEALPQDDQYATKKAALEGEIKAVGDNAPKDDAALTRSIYKIALDLTFCLAPILMHERLKPVGHVITGSYALYALWHPDAAKTVWEIAKGNHPAA